MTLTRRKLFGFASLPLAMTAMSAKALPTPAPQKYDGEFDVIILGAGGAGLSAACAASEKGAKVLVLEKNAFPGGSSLITDAMFAVQGTKEQEAKGIKDSPELYAKDLYDVGQHFNEPGLPEALAKASLEQFKWMTEVLGVHPFALLHQGGQSVPRSHQFKAPVVIKAMLEYAKKHGAEVLTSISGKRLLWDSAEQRICGVKAETSKGEMRNYRARKGVIICSGGFSRNEKVLRRFNPYLRDVQVLSGGGSMGEGLLMAQAYGADVRDMNFIEATFGAKPGMKSIDELSFMQFFGGILVNKDGKRFVNEGRTYMELSHEAVRQPEGKAYTVFSHAKAERAVKENPELARMWKDLAEGRTPDWVFAGKTVKEAAEKAGIKAKELEETVRRYNADVEKGRDSEFGRQYLEGQSGKLVKIEGGDIYPRLGRKHPL